MINVFGCGLFDASGCDTSIWIFLSSFLIPTLLVIGFALGIVAILISTISLITSAGDESASKDAKEKLQSSIIGLVIIMLMLTLVKVVIDSVSGGVINPDISGGLKGP